MQKKYFFFLIAIFMPSIICAQATNQSLYFSMQDYPPFYSQEGNAPFTGAAVEMSQEACKRLKIKCSFGMTTFARLLVELKDGKVDAAPFIVDDPKSNPERVVYIQFSNPIYQSNYAYMGLASKVSAVQKIEDLNGWTIGIVRNSYADKLIKKANEKSVNFTVISDTTVPTLLKKLITEHYGQQNNSAILVSEDVARYYASLLDVKLTTVFVPETKLYAVGFSRKTVDDKTVQAFNGVIQKMKEDGTLKEIAKKYGVALIP